MKNNFAKARELSKLKQNEASSLLGISPQCLSRYEKAQTEPSFELLKKMSDLYCLSIDFLLCNDINGKVIFSNEQSKFIQFFLQLQEPYLTMAMTYVKKLLDDQTEVENQRQKNNYWHIIEETKKDE